MKEQRLRQVPLFANLPDTEIENLAKTLRPVEFHAGSMLFREGDPGDTFYILLEGKIEIIKEMDTPDERLLGIRSAGSMVGEMSLFSAEHRRTASVRARTFIQMLEMTRIEFDALLHRQPMLAYSMVSTLSKRLDETENITIRDLRIKNQELTVAYQELKAAQEQLIEKEKLEQELKVAQRIQLSMMPRQLPQHPNFRFEAHIQPMRLVGGDFYDFIPLDPNHLGVAIGDVSDHGIPAALFMAMTVTLLRAEAARSASPEVVLRQLNQQLLKSNTMNMFVTLLYGVLDYTSGEFVYARAGHELPILRDQSGNARQLDLVPGAILGVFDPATIEQTHQSLQPGETLLLYTDGVTDELDSQGTRFGLPNLLADFQGLAKSGDRQDCSALLERLNYFRGENPQFDDITLMAIHARTQH